MRAVHTIVARGAVADFARIVISPAVHFAVHNGAGQIESRRDLSHTGAKTGHDLRRVALIPIAGAGTRIVRLSRRAPPVAAPAPERAADDRTRVLIAGADSGDVRQACR